MAGPWSESASLQVVLQQLWSGGEEPQPGSYQKVELALLMSFHRSW